jgi:hypothetical protein
MPTNLKAGLQMPQNEVSGLRNASDDGQKIDRNKPDVNFSSHEQPIASARRLSSSVRSVQDKHTHPLNGVTS